MWALSSNTNVLSLYLRFMKPINEIWWKIKFRSRKFTIASFHAKVDCEMNSSAFSLKRMKGIQWVSYICFHRLLPSQGKTLIEFFSSVSPELNTDVAKDHRTTRQDVEKLQDCTECNCYLIFIYCVGICYAMLCSHVMQFIAEATSQTQTWPG